MKVRVRRPKQPGKHLNLKRGLHFVEALGLAKSAGNVEFIFEGDLNKVEFVIHEMAHMLSLGLPVTSGGMAEVGNRLRDLPDRGLREEALVLSAEKIVFASVGIEMDPADLEDAANIQGVKPELLAEMRGSAKARALARRLLRRLEAEGIISG